MRPERRPPSSERGTAGSTAIRSRSATSIPWIRLALLAERGTVIAMTDGSGTVTRADKDNAAGVPDSGNSGRFQFTGQMWIAEASVYHFKARAYHPGLGRF